MTQQEKRTWRWGLSALLVALALLFAGGVFAVQMLLDNIRARKAEARQVVFPIVNLTERTVDPAEWGKNFPRHYDHYRRTVDMTRTRFGGSEADPFHPQQTFSRIEEDPRLRTMWAGYAFATDFREERGHAYMLTDQRTTERVLKFNQPGACLHCHASIVDAYRVAGVAQGAPGTPDEPLLTDHGLKQLFAGFEAMCALPYTEATKTVEHPVSCTDCHDPQSLNLRVTRPGFLNGIQRLAESSDPVPHLPSVERWRQGDRAQPYNPNTLANRQEMRSFVCGQCHVEYYFHGEGKLLTYPWHNGLKVQQIEAYYNQPTFQDKAGNTGPYADWKHALTDAPALKAQHPEFELWSQGIHARSGVACADCHMPYLREGAVKISDHHVRSPLLQADKSCQTCHNFPQEELVARAEGIQARTREVMGRAQDALQQLIDALAAAKAAGRSDAAVTQARQLQRSAQFRIDFINAENSMGFHAPGEALRILSEAIDHARQGQLVLLQPTPTPAATAAATP